MTRTVHPLHSCMVAWLVVAWTIGTGYSQTAFPECSVENSLRLVNGDTQLEGRVEICKSGEWGTVCDDLWDDLDAQVVCAQLGFLREGAVGLLRAEFGQGTGTIRLDNVQCVGTELQLIDCSHLSDHNCLHHEDASVRCQPSSICREGDIRLENGDGTVGQGRVEVCHNNEWGTVCDDLWDDTDASVVCAQLGYSRRGAQAFSRAHFGRGSSSIWLDDVQCSGTESRLIDCTHDPNTGDCSHFEDAGVICNTVLSCVQGDLQLVGGDTPNEGRVEVCLNEMWGTVCDDSWSNEDAQVVCRQLGLATINAVSMVKFGLGTGPIYLDNVQCSGSESRLIDCLYDSHTSDCTHIEDAGVRCQLTCTRGDVRIGESGRVSPSEGRVEVCLDHVWGTVCDDRWDNLDANVACRQLGFSRFSAIAYQSAAYGLGSGTIHLDELGCTGTEVTLLDCTHLTSHDCSHFEDAGVMCNTTLLCENGAIRLVGGSMTNEGRVEVCWNETWGTVCDNGWTTPDAQVACRQLGLSSSSTSVISYTNAHFGQGSGVILLSNLGCGGSEARLTDCSHSGFGSTASCTHGDDVGVRCGPRVCTNWDIRLVNGLTDYEGRVEVCWNEQWGTVCDDFWDDLDARVVCNQLAFNSTISATGYQRSPSLFGAGTGPILLDNVQCIGTELSIQQCSASSIGSHNCVHLEDSGVRCAQCIENSVRLVGGASDYEGRVEVCLGGGWGTVCDDDWTSEDAAVVCRQLGLPVENAVASLRASFGRGTGLPILIDNVRCTSTETRLTACAYLDAKNLRSCAADHSEDAGVVCRRPPPGVPQSITTSSITTTSLIVSWSHPLNSTIHSYVLRYSLNCTTTAGYPNASYLSSDNSTLLWSFTVLHPYTSYSCCVAGIGAGGQGEPACQTVQTLETVPTGSPRNVRGSSTSSVSLSLIWDSPLPELINGRIREYHVSIIILDTAETISYLITEPRLGIASLHPYYRYQCSVAAVTTGLGPFSAPVTIRTYQDVPSGTPRSIQAVSNSPTTINLTWRLPHPEHRNGIITGYSITVTVASNGQQQQYTTTNDRSYTIISLQIYTRYIVTIAASTVNGTGPKSIGYEVVTMEGPPTRAPRSVSVVSLSSSSVRVTWISPAEQYQNGMIRGHIVDMTELETDTLQQFNTTSEMIVIAELHPFYRYRFSVASYTTSIGPYSSSLAVQMPQDVPSGPPLNVQVSMSFDSTISSVTVTWDPPDTEHRNGIIVGYVVTLRNFATGVTSSHSTSSQQFVFSLQLSSEFTVTVAAQTNVGSGPASTVYTFDTNTDIPSPAPRNFRILQPVGSTTMSFAWIPPQYSGSIVGYTLTLIEEETGDTLTFNVTSDTAHTARSLHPYYNYMCSVAAYNDVGIGPYTSSIVQRTAQDAPSGYPSSVRAVSVSPREIVINWNSLLSHETNGIITGYVINVMVMGVQSEQSYQIETENPPHTLTTLPYTTYMVTVAARTSVGTGPVSTELIIETPEEAPSHHPQNVSVDVIRPTSFRLSWRPPPLQYHHGDIRQYNITVTEVQTGRHFSFTSETTEFVVMDLHPYYLYNCSVAAVTVDAGPHSAVLMARTAEDAPTAAPTNVQVRAIYSTAVRVEWEPPPIQHQNGIIREYTIYVYDPSLQYSILITASQFEIFSGLNPFTSYEVSVAASTVSLGPQSAQIAVTTPEDVPGRPPRNIRATKDNPTTLTVTWSPPRVSNGVITHYQVQLFDILTDTVSGREVTEERSVWTDLHPYYTYKYSVAAATSVGLGPFSENGTVQMDEAAPSSPPLNIQVDIISSTSVTVSWTPPPMEDHNGIITAYNIYLQEMDEVGEFTSYGTTHLLTNLLPSNQYSVSVAAVTVREGPSSGEVEFTTLDDVPGSPTNFQVQVLSSRSVSLSWSAPSEDQQNGVIQQYIINVTSDMINEPIIFETTSLVYTVMSLHPSWIYRFGVAAETSAGIGPFSVQAATLFEDAPTAPPQNLQGSSPASTLLILNWSPPPVGKRNGVIREYRVTISNDETGVVTSYTAQPQRNMYALEGLHPFYTYNCSVAAHTVGTGPSASIKIRQPEDVPGHPTDLTINHISPTTVTISWSPVPAHLENGIIIGYTVRADGTNAQEDSVGPNQFEYQFRDLRAYTAYNFSVAAMTSAGRGLPITVVSRTQEGAPTFVPTVGSVTRISATEIQVNWESHSSEDTQRPLTSYLVRYRVVESRVRRNLDDTATVIEVQEPGTVISGLDPQLVYAVSIAAKNNAGVGNYSEEIVAGLFDNSPFQVHLYGAIVCVPWIGSGVAEKVNDIIIEVSQSMGSTCDCEVPPKYIGQGKVVCGDRSTDRVIFRGTFISTDNKESGEIRDQFQEWVYSEPTMIVQGVQLRVAPCSVVIDDSSVCPIYPTTAESVTTPVVTAEESSGISFPLIGGVAGGLLVLICAAFTLILIVVVMKKRQAKRDARVGRRSHDLNLNYTLSPGEATNGTTNVTSFTKESEFEDAKAKEAGLFEDEHIYDDPSMFQTIGQPSEPPPSYTTSIKTFNRTALSGLSALPLATSGASQTTNRKDFEKPEYSQLDVTTMPVLHYNNVGSSTVTTQVDDKEYSEVVTSTPPQATNGASDYSHLDVSAMPTLHYNNIGVSATIPNDYEYLPSLPSEATPTQQPQYSEQLAQPHLDQSSTTVNRNRSSVSSDDRPANYQPLLPPPRQAKNTPSPMYQPLGAPSGYDVPKTQSDVAMTRSDVPQPSLGGWNGTKVTPLCLDSQQNGGSSLRSVDESQEQDDYIEMTSPTL